MKNLVLLIAAFLVGLTFGMAQDIEGVYVEPKYNTTEAQVNADKDQCYTYADSQFEKKKRRTLKNTGVGAGIGAVVGKIFGKTGTGAAAGGAAGAVRGHRKNNKEERAFNETYASCLREKGYAVEIEED